MREREKVSERERLRIGLREIEKDLKGGDPRELTDLLNFRKLVSADDGSSSLSFAKLRKLSIQLWLRLLIETGH